MSETGEAIPADETAEPIQGGGADESLQADATVESGEGFAQAVRLAEAVIFASREPVTLRVLANLLPDHADPDAVLAALAQSYAGRGVGLAAVAGGWQFRTADDLAPVLRKIVELPRRLPRVAMETLAIVGYHQPVTRTEIEEIRGASLSQNTLDLLLENGLITPKGRRESPGRPTLWGTTPAFLAQFGLNDLRDLPKREELLIDPNPVLAPPQPEPVADAEAEAEAEAETESLVESETVAEAEPAPQPEQPPDPAS